jgi:predicted secreted protein
MTTQEYWEREGSRLLTEDNRPPTVEERVKAAYLAGFEQGVKYTLRTQPINDNE